MQSQQIIAKERNLFESKFSGDIPVRHMLKEDVTKLDRGGGDFGTERSRAESALSFFTQSSGVPGLGSKNNSWSTHIWKCFKASKNRISKL